MIAKPLEGMRVVDFGIITAGASTSATLADLGAEVIKVEGPSYIDPFRIWVGKGAGDDWWNDSPQYAFTNRNKRGVCIDVKNPRGRELLLSLVARSDSVVENFRVGVMERLGLGFASLREANPHVILASISSQGASGPDAESVSFGSTLEASSGLSSMIPGPDGQPLISGHALNYPDQVVSLLAAAIIMTAAVERERDPERKAIHLDISQRELTAFMIGEWFGIEATPETMAAERGEERILPSADGRWIACTLPPGGRLSPADEAEVGRLSAEEAVRALRALGHRAEIALEAREVFAACRDRPDLAAFTTDTQGNPVKGLPWTSGSIRPDVARAAPSLGQCNAWLVETVLGLSPEERAELEAEGVLATRPRAG